jgi:RNA polymerase sigma-70 factor (ECF subfamily)
MEKEGRKMLSLCLALIDTQEDKTLFEKIYYRYRKQMYYVSYKILNDDHLTEDALQNAFIGIATHITKFRDISPEKARVYVLTAARNAAINVYNQERRIRGNVVSPETMDLASVNDSFEEIEQTDMVLFLLKIIESLPQLYRDVLMLHYVQDLNCAEIAITIGKSHAATRQILVRARKALRSACRKAGVSVAD